MSDSNCLLLTCEPEVAIAAIYRSPSRSNANGFLNSLDNLLTTIASCKTALIVGDININITTGNTDSNSEEYLNLTASHGLLPAYNKSTREASGACIDHVIMKTKNKHTISLILDIFATDHSPVILHTEHSCPYKEGKSRVSTALDFDSITKELGESDFSPVLNSVDANLAADILIDIIGSVIKRNTRTKKKYQLMLPLLSLGLLWELSNV